MTISTYFKIVLLMCFLSFYLGQSTLAQCIIDLDELEITTASGSTTICANEPLTLPELNFLANENYPDATIMWAVYDCQPTTTNPSTDSCNSSFVVLSDELGTTVLNGGEAFFSNTNLLGVDDVSITVYIVPIIKTNDDPDNFIYDEDCTGINIDYEYPMFTILNPDHPDNEAICDSACEGATEENDNCANAFDLVLTTNIYGAYTNTCATSIDDPSFPGGNDCFFEADPYAATVWFHVIGNGGTYSITTQDCVGSAADQLADAQMAIYSGDCGDLVFEYCDDDGGEGFAASIEFESVAGTDYYIIVDGGGANVGEFCLEVVEIEEPPVCEAETGTITFDHAFTICEGETVRWNS